MDTRAFNEKNFGESRAVCERIEREDGGGDYKIEANKLRNQLDTSERKSERRLRQIDYLESVIRNRNAELKERKQLIHELRNEVRRLGKQVSDLSAERENGGNCVVLTDREREILDMWPKFEDGECVWFGDAVAAHHEGAITVDAIEFSHGKVCVKDAEDGDWNTSMYAMHPLKRPAPKVLDADGVEIKVGDTVYEPNGQSGIVTAVHPSTRCVDLRQDDCDAYAMDAKRLTHTRPDSWKRLEEDAAKDECDYFKQFDGDCGGCSAEGVDVDCRKVMARDLVRRAKALAGVSV